MSRVDWERLILARIVRPCQGHSNGESRPGRTVRAAASVGSTGESPIEIVHRQDPYAVGERVGVGRAADDRGAPHSCGSGNAPDELQVDGIAADGHFRPLGLDKLEAPSDVGHEIHFTRAVAPSMKAGRRGSIVNISSGAGRSHSLTGIQAYASAKAGLIGFTRQTARELGPHGIRVNCVAPGFVRSNPATERQWQAMGEAGQQRLMESIALRRLGEPEDIARAVVFFASDDARYVTGQTISVDGGHWMLG